MSDTERLNWLEKNSACLMQENVVKTGEPYRWWVEVSWIPAGKAPLFNTPREAIDDMMEKYPDTKG